MASPSDDGRATRTALRSVRIKSKLARAKHTHLRALEQSDYERELDAQERRAHLTIVRGDA
jgi:hypothetical protein